MYISKIFLEHFGKFDQRAVDLEQGVNCIYGKNEDGKSTIKSFLAYILSSLHQPYSSQRITELYKKYEPFYSESFRGHLLCDDIGESDQGVRIYQDFHAMDRPMVTDFAGEEILLEADKINVIGFHELQGENSKDLLLDILNRIEDLKNSNLYGVHANDIYGKIKAIPEDFKESIHYLDLKKDLGEIDDFLKEYDQKYHTYQEEAKSLYEARRMLKSLEEEIQAQDLHLEKANVMAILKLQESVSAINEDIEKYKEQLEALKPYSDANIEEAEKTLTANKELDSIKMTIKDKKNQLYETEKRIRVMAMGRDMKHMIKLTYEDNIKQLRGLCRELIDHSNKIDTIRSSLMDYVELREKASPYSDDRDVDMDFDTAVMAKDYYKYVNMTDWGNSIRKELADLEANQPDYEAGKLLEAKMKQMRVFAILGLVGAVMGSVLSVLFTEYFIVLGVLGLGVAGFFTYLYLATKDAFLHHGASISTYYMEVEKVKQMILDNDEKKLVILHRYSCQTEREFISYYNNNKDAQESSEALEEKIQRLENDLRDQEMAMKLSVNAIKEAEKHYGIEMQAYMLDPHTLLNQVESYIQESKEYMRLYNSLHDLKEEVRLLEEEAQGMPDPESEATNDIEQKSIAYQLAYYELERLESKKAELLKEMSEEELTQRAEALNGSSFFGSLQLDHKAESSRALLRDNKVKMSALVDQITHMKQEAQRQEVYLSKAHELRVKRQYIVEQLREIEGLEERVQLAVQEMRSSSVEVSSHIKDKVEDKVGGIIYEITNKYSRVRFTADMDIEFYHQALETWKPVKDLSAGTIDQVYIALRLALIDLTRGDNNYPMVFDDSFVQYDKKRLSRILMYLSTLDRQVIILTCHKRESQLMDHLAINYNCIQLS